MTDVQPARHADSAAAPGTPPDAHTVQRGDTLWAISRQYGLPLSDLIAANPQIANPDLIYPEQQIHLPAHAAADAAPPTASPVTDGRLVQGASGPEVATLQQQLRDLGYYHGNIGGTFGPLTDAAVRNFQRDHGLVVDGWAGPQTQAALQAATQGGGAPPSTSAPPVNGAPNADVRAALDFGLAQLGAPYVGGGSPYRFGTPGNGGTYQMDGQLKYRSPAGVIGFDCSGLVVAMYRQAGVDLAAMGIANTRSMQSGLAAVDKGELQPGDLLVKGGSHVVIYLGDTNGDGRAEVLEATSDGDGNGDGVGSGDVRISDAGKFLDNPAYVGRRVPAAWYG